MKLLLNILAIGIFPIIISQVSGAIRLSGNLEPITSGQISRIFEYPWVASIQKNFKHSCAGSIISRNIVLTAASCFAVMVPVNNITVRVGSSRMDYGPAISGGSRQNVEVIVLHESYNTVTDLNNLALVRVWPLFEFNRTVNKIELASKWHRVVMGSSATVAGWSWIDNMRADDLRSIELKITNLWACRNSDRLVCAIPSNGQICLIDVGAPLVANGTLVGLSYSNTECTEIFNKVSVYRDWIDKSMKILGSISV